MRADGCVVLVTCLCYKCVPQYPMPVCSGEARVGKYSHPHRAGCVSDMQWWRQHQCPDWLAFHVIAFMLVWSP